MKKPAYRRPLKLAKRANNSTVAIKIPQKKKMKKKLTSTS